MWQKASDFYSVQQFRWPGFRQQQCWIFQRVEKHRQLHVGPLTTSGCVMLELNEHPEYLRIRCLSL